MIDKIQEAAAQVETATKEVADWTDVYEAANEDYKAMLNLKEIIDRDRMRELNERREKYATILGQHKGTLNYYKSKLQGLMQAQELQYLEKKLKVAQDNLSSQALRFERAREAFEAEQRFWNKGSAEVNQLTEKISELKASFQTQGGY